MNWQVDSENWMRVRKSEWLELKNKSLDLHTWFSKSDFKQLRNYFLTGQEELSNPLPDYTHGKRLSKYPVPLFIKLWFYPEKDVEHLRTLVFEAKKRDLKDCYHSFGWSTYQIFNTEYGFMGGREELVSEVLYGQSLDEYKEIYCKAFTSSKTDEAYANQFRGVPSGIGGWLRHGYPVFSFVQYLYFHWYQSLSDRTDLDDESIKGDTVYMMNQVLHFKDPMDLPPEESRYYKVAKQLEDIFENKSLPPVITDLWKKVKNNEVDIPEWYQ